MPTDLKPTGIAGWSYYPTDSGQLKDIIRASANFNTLGEVSSFASVLVEIVAAQAKQIEELKRRLDEVEAWT